MTTNLIPLIKELRKLTQAGFADCKQALITNKGDLTAAIAWLKTKGIAKAVQRFQNTASQGVTFVSVLNDKGVVLELNCETDFVAQNEQFISFYHQIAQIGLGEKNVNDWTSNQTISQKQIELSAQFGEKISLTRTVLWTKTSQQSWGWYQHNTNKISVLVLFDQPIPAAVSKDLAMHIAASNPMWISASDITYDWQKQEQDIIQKTFIQKGFSGAKLKMIVEKAWKTLCQEVCLLEQPFFKNNKIRVQEILKKHDTSILKMLRWSLGETTCTMQG